MDFEKIKDLMQTLNSSDLMDFELKLNDGFYLRMNKYKEHYINNKEKIDNNQIKEFKEEYSVHNESSNKKSDFDSLEKNSNLDEKNEIKEGNIINSPIVGTFYSSSSPTKPPFVKVGDKVKEGDILCIIEAMKVMNEIKSNFEGEIVEILVSNEDMVEYGQPLFRII